MKKDDRHIGEALYNIGAISYDDFQDVLARQARGDKRVFGEIAIAYNYINDEALWKSICRFDNSLLIDLNLV